MEILDIFFSTFFGVVCALGVISLKLELKT